MVVRLERKSLVKEMQSMLAGLDVALNGGRKERYFFVWDSGAGRGRLQGTYHKTPSRYVQKG